MRIPEDVARALAPAENSEIWKTVIKMIDASIQSEAAQAVGREIRGEDRAWHCGRVDALMSLKDVLVETQNESAKQLGYSSSENGATID